VGLTTLPPSCANCLEIWEPILLEPSGPVQTCNGISFTLVRHFSVPLSVFIVTLHFVFQIHILLFSFGAFYVLVSHIHSSELLDSG